MRPPSRSRIRYSSSVIAVCPYDHIGLPGMRLGVDKERIAVLPDDEASVMRVTFAIHAFAGARIAQNLNGAEFEHPGADAFQHIGFRLPLDDDAVDSVAVQQMREEQASRAAADDRDLSARHVHSLWIVPANSTPTEATCSGARWARLE